MNVWWVINCATIHSNHAINQNSFPRKKFSRIGQWKLEHFFFSLLNSTAADYRKSTATPCSQLSLQHPVYLPMIVSKSGPQTNWNFLYQAYVHLNRYSSILHLVVEQNKPDAKGKLNIPFLTRKKNNITYNSCRFIKSRNMPTGRDDSLFLWRYLESTKKYIKWPKQFNFSHNIKAQGKTQKWSLKINLCAIYSPRKASITSPVEFKLQLVPLATLYHRYSNITEIAQSYTITGNYPTLLMIRKCQG